MNKFILFQTLLLCITSAISCDRHSELTTSSQTDEDKLTSFDIIDVVGAYRGSIESEIYYLVIRKDYSTSCLIRGKSGDRIYDGKWAYEDAKSIYRIEFMNEMVFEFRRPDTNQEILVAVNNEEYEFNRQNFDTVPYLGKDGNLTSDPQGQSDAINFPNKILGYWYGLPGTSACRILFTEPGSLISDWPKDDLPEVDYSFYYHYTVSNDGELIYYPDNKEWIYEGQITYLSNKRMTIKTTYKDGGSGYGYYSKDPTSWWIERNDNTEDSSSDNTGSNTGTNGDSESENENGNSGSTGSSTDHHYPCKSCSETGDCWNCFGSGKDPITQKRCNTCRGSGKCQTCRGKGYIII